ncbi:MAG: hypothetical protein JWQ27_1405 [Ferruginibacter sp.]|nr:hypothetical protein [Ferruginibacter sp.]
MTDPQNGKGRGYLALGVTSIVWGTTWIASKFAVHEMPALQMAAIRQLIAGLCFVLFFLIYKKAGFPSARQFRWLFVMAVLMFVFANGLSTWSLQYIPTGLSALIGALYPLSVVIIEKIFYKTAKLTALTFIGLFLGITGVGIVFYENAFNHYGPAFLTGITLSAIAMLSWSFGTVFLSRNKTNMNPYYGTGWQMLIGSMMLFILSEATQPTVPVASISGKAWLLIGYLVLFGSVLSFIAFIYSMRKLSPAVASLYAYINPLVAMLLGAVLLDEKITGYILWGAIVTLAGVFLVNYSIRKQRKNIIAEPEQ